MTMALKNIPCRLCFGQPVYLCNQPNCEHDSEKCTAWVAPFEGSVTPVATENNLFLIYSGTTQNAKIEQMGLNGENKKIIFYFFAAGGH